MDHGTNEAALPAEEEISAPEISTPMRMLGASGDFIKLCIRGNFFTLLTLGLYRFWFLTDLRRWLWSKTAIGEDRFEYTGTGKELFLGFLVALGILGPLYLAVTVLTFEAERQRAFASLGVGLVFALFGIYASYRARRYRLTRTIFRGVRFGMSGSAGKYLLIYVGYGLLTVLTLGLAFPWMSRACERYKMQNSFYGDLQGDFVGRPGVFFKRGILLWILGMASLALIATTVLHQNTFLVFVGMLAGAASILWMRGVQWRWWAEGVSFGEIRATANFPHSIVLREAVKYLFASIGATILYSIGITIVLGIAAGVAYAVGGQEMLNNMKGLEASLKGGGWQFYALMAGIIVNYAIIILILSIVSTRYFVFGVWRRVVDGIALVGLGAVERVSGTQTASGATGEALADALDFGF